MRYDISKASAPSMPKLGKGTKHPQNTSKSPLKSLKKHTETPRSHAFPFTWRTHPLRKKSVSRSHLEGFLHKMAISERQNAHFTR